MKNDDVAFLGADPGDDVTEGWWDEMLVQWFDVPEEAQPLEGEETSVESEAAAVEEKSSKA